MDGVSRQNVARLHIDIGGRACHHAQAQEHFEVLERARRGNATVFEHSSEAGQFRDESSGCFCAFGIGSSKEQHLAVLVRVADESDDGVGLTGGPSKSGGDIFRLLVRTRMKIANDFLSRILVIDKAEIELIAEESGPGIGARASEKNKIIVGLQVG